LIHLVRDRCKKFKGQAIANVLHGLAVLHADFGVHAVDEELAKDLVNVAEREARGMNEQHVANDVLNALGKLDAAASQMSMSG
jgi:hypothetical protein